MRLRQAVRALVLDPDNRILLDERLMAAGGTIWATPGGGINGGESHEQALRRELSEELGLHAFELGPEVWWREHLLPLLGFEGQREHFHLVRVDSFEPSGTPDPDVVGQRWWTLAELETSHDLFAPRRLPELLATLLRDGPSGEPIDVGV